MGCGCKISEPVVVGAYVDHSECRFAELQDKNRKLREALKHYAIGMYWEDELEAPVENRTEDDRWIVWNGRGNGFDIARAALADKGGLDGL